MSKMTTRERILKYCNVSKKEATSKSDTIFYGDRSLRMSRMFKNVPDEDVEKIFKDKEIGIGDYVRKAEKGKAKTTRKPTATLDPKPCECGCKQMTRRGSRFLPGHDMKLKSKLIKAARGGNKSAEEELRSRGWFKAMAKVKAKAKPKVKAKVKAKAKTSGK